MKNLYLKFTTLPFITRLAVIWLLIVTTALTIMAPAGMLMVLAILMTSASFIVLLKYFIDRE